jgi:hypothetical protein
LLLPSCVNGGRELRENGHVVPYVRKMVFIKTYQLGSCFIVLIIAMNIIVQMQEITKIKHRSEAIAI